MLLLVIFPVDKLPLYALQTMYWIGSTVEPSVFRYAAAWADVAAKAARRNSVKMRVEKKQTINSKSIKIILIINVPFFHQLTRNGVPAHLIDN